MEDEEVEEIVVDPYPVDNASTIEWFQKARPNKHWAAPFVTHKKYYVRWLQGLDFTELDVRIEPALWQQDNGSIELILPFYEEREVIDFTSDVAGLHANKTLTETAEADLVMGMNVVYNRTETREIHFVVNGRDNTEDLTIKGY